MRKHFWKMHVFQFFRDIWNDPPHINVEKCHFCVACRGETRALIGGGEYSYLRVLPDEFLLKSVVIKVNFKRNSSGRT